MSKYRAETINMFENVGVVNQYQNPVAQSKDEIIKARIEPRRADGIRAFCAGRQITTSDYIRHHLKLDPAYFDFIDQLNELREQLLPLLQKIPKKF